MMTRIVLILAATLAFVSTASAKLPYQAVEDLVGQKTIVTRWKAPSFSGLTPSKKPSKGTTSVARAEFHFLGAMDLWIIDGSGNARDVNVTIGTLDSFSWSTNDGHTYAIENYPLDNNHATVKGSVYNDETGAQVGTFRMIHRLNAAKVGNEAAGRWTGEVVFPGGFRTDLSLNVAQSRRSIAGCTHGSSPARVAMSGYGYQDAALTHCEKEYFEYGSYHASFFVWDDHNDALWFMGLEGFMTDDGQFLQGRVHTFELLGDGGWSEGFFSLERPQSFNP